MFGNPILFISIYTDERTYLHTTHRHIHSLKLSLAFMEAFLSIELLLARFSFYRKTISFGNSYVPSGKIECISISFSFQISLCLFNY